MPQIVPETADETSLQAFLTTLLRHRRAIYACAALGVAVGVSIALIRGRVYETRAAFIPESNSASASSSLAMAASQFGIQLPIPSGGATWGPLVFVELLRSRDVLETIARDTVAVTEENRRAPVLTLLKIPADLPPDRQIERAVDALRKIVIANEDKRLGGVTLSVTTRWPSVSYAITQRLLAELNEFTLVKRKSQATAEREVAERLAAEAEKALRAAEDQLQDFQIRNRVTNSPTLSLERDRLQRKVSLQQAVFTTLVQSREEARIREVRDTPVVTIIQEPHIAASPKPRRLGSKAIFGLLFGTVAGVLVALLLEGAARARRSASPETREVFRLLDEATPRFLRRRSAS